MQILLVLGLPNHPLPLQILLHALWSWWPHQYLCNDPSQQTGSRRAENGSGTGNFTAWFCISEWKRSQELQGWTEICKRKNLKHRHAEPHKLSGSDVDSFISTLLPCYFCPTSQSCTSVGRHRPSPWKCLWKCLTSQSDREHLVLNLSVWQRTLPWAKTVGTIHADNSKWWEEKSPRERKSTSSEVEHQPLCTHIPTECCATCWMLHRESLGHSESGMILRHRPTPRRRRSDGETVTRIFGFCTTSKLYPWTLSTLPPLKYKSSRSDPPVIH